MDSNTAHWVPRNKLNLQTSFLTPPFGFSLFYLKGVAPPEVHTDIYRGVIPFIVLQMIVLGILVLFPQWFGLSAHQEVLHFVAKGNCSPYTRSFFSSGVRIKT